MLLGGDRVALEVGEDPVLGVERHRVGRDLRGGLSVATGDPLHERPHGPAPGAALLGEQIPEVGGLRDALAHVVGMPALQPVDHALDPGSLRRARPGRSAAGSS